ncbi:MAG: hypothetical protein ABI273_11480 [Lacunisphaera sp.]
MTTNSRTDYAQIAAQLNYAALDKKLEQLVTIPPPKKRKQVADLLAPVEPRLRELRAKGWTFEQLAKELTDFGLPVKSSALRDHLAVKTPKVRHRRHQRGAAVAC